MSPRSSASLPRFLFPEPFKTDFSLRNLPYGVFSSSANSGTKIGVALGDRVIDCHKLAELGVLPSYFLEPTLNGFMGAGKSAWDETRAKLKKLLGADENNGELPDVLSSKGCGVNEVAVPMADVTMHLPAEIGDYTDFYASREHATNVGCMFRDPDNALLPNWLHIPVGYHGRASSVFVSGTDVVRPHGQTVAKDQPEGPPTFGPSKLVDFELEVGAFIGGPQTAPGETLSLSQAEDRLFGLVLLNDWSARDMQKWEYVPLGPFLAKNFGTVISPWVVPAQAFEEAAARVPTPPQNDPTPLSYIRQPEGAKSGFDVELKCDIEVRGARTTVTATNLKWMYWSLGQQLCHHASNGCVLKPGDLIGSGTISGPTKDSYGSMLELSWAGRDKVPVAHGEERVFLQDNDSVIMTGSAGEGIGFGECRSGLLPAKKAWYGE